MNVAGSNRQSIIIQRNHPVNLHRNPPVETHTNAYVQVHKNQCEQELSKCTTVSRQGTH